MSQIFASVNSDYRNHQNLVTLPKIYLGTIWFTSPCSSNLTSPWQLRFDKQFFRILKFSLFHWNWSIFGHFGAFHRSQMAVVWGQLTSNSYVVWRYQHMLRQNKHFWRAICPLGVTDGGAGALCVRFLIRSRKVVELNKISRRPMEGGSGNLSNSPLPDYWILPLISSLLKQISL